MRTVALAALLTVAYAALDAQAPVPQIPTTADVAFDAASIKPNKSGDGNSGTSTSPGGLLRATNVALRRLILNAYRLRDFQLEGNSPFLDERFDIVARAAAENSGVDIGVMMRRLLAERFGLVVHVETRDQPVYALVLARRDGTLGPQLMKSSADCAPKPPPAPRACGMNSSSGAGGGTLKGTGQTMAALANNLAFSVDRLVIDRTGLSGLFDLELRYSRDEARVNVPSAADEPTLFTALQEQLGLKIEATRGPVEFVVIDRVAAPTPD